MWLLLDYKVVSVLSTHRYIFINFYHITKNTTNKLDCYIAPFIGNSNMVRLVELFSSIGGTIKLFMYISLAIDL